MKLHHAQRLAACLVQQMQPHCQPDSVQVLGSIRRGKPEVKDIELIALPLMVTQASLLDDAPALIRSEALLRWAMDEKTRRIIRWVKAGRGTLQENNLEPVERLDVNGNYWRGLVTASGWEPVMLDLFLPRPESYVAQTLIRTGSADFSHAVVTHALRVGYRFDKGSVWRISDGLLMRPKNERELFALLSLRYLEPSERIDKNSLRGIG